MPLASDSGGNDNQRGACIIRTIAVLVMNVQEDRFNLPNRLLRAECDGGAESERGSEVLASTGMIPEFRIL